MYQHAVTGLISLFACGLFTGIAVAQDRSISQAYAEGVHAYFSGDHSAAIKWLGQAITRADHDPRAHYFRGAAHWAIGEQEQAEADFKAGAEREVFGPSLPYALNKVLERVQGAARVRIEAARTAARKHKASQAAALKQARYEALRRAKQLVLYPPRPLPNAEKIVAQLKLATLPSDPFQSGTLFAAGQPAPEGSQSKALTIPVSKPAAPGGAVAPAGKPTPPAAGGDPFGDPFGSPKQPAPKKKPPKSDDPFGDPFGN